MKRLAIVLGLATIALSPGTASADSCIDLRTSQVYDCNAMPPGAKPQRVLADPQTERLRQKMRDLLQQPSSSADETQRKQRVANNINAAMDACHRGNMVEFEAQMGQASGLATPAENQQLLGQVRQACAATRADAKPNQPQPAQQAMAPAPVAPPDPNLFTTCGAPDRQGVQTCYEAPPSGYSCRKVLKKGGDAVWTDDQATCDSTAILQQRNAYFNALKAQTPPPKPLFGEGDVRKQEALNSLPAGCRADLNNLLQGADTGDKEKAYTSYARLRATCDAQTRALASAAETALPERILSSRARTALDKAMRGDPGRLAESVGDRSYDASYDAGQVITFGLTLLNVLSGFAGVYAAIPQGGGNMGSIGNRPVGHSYGQGSPIHTAPPSRQSTITGLGR